MKASASAARVPAAAPAIAQPSRTTTARTERGRERPAPAAAEASGFSHVRLAANGQPLQRRLAVDVSEPLEREADAMADRVMRMADPDRAIGRDQPPSLARKCAACAAEHEEDEREDDEQKLRRRHASARDNLGGTTAPAIVHDVLGSPGRPLASSERRFFEPRFGYDFGSVRVHADSRAAASADAVNALAYTVEHNIVFAQGRYQPGDTAARHLMAHELTHVVQQGRAARAEGGVAPAKPAVARKARTDRQYDLLAAHVHDGIYRLGTDEELVYQALQELDRDPVAIAEFMDVYRNYIARVENKAVNDLPADLLIQDIEGDFSGGELEFALQLLNRGTKDAAQQIEAGAPGSEAALTSAAKRLLAAVDTIWGTDEEAIYAVLLPFGRDQTKLQPLRDAYKKIASGEDLETRLLDEMSGSELDYAIYLLFDPKRAYDFYLRQASDTEFSSFVTGGARTVGSDCVMPKGDAFNKTYWEKGNPNGNEMCALMAKTGGRPSEAVKALFDYMTADGFTGALRGAAENTVASPGWRVDCAEWVQIHHLYAMLKLLGPYRFDLKFGNSPFWLKEHRTTGLSSRMFFLRSGFDTDTRRPREEMAPVKLDKGSPQKKKGGDYDVNANEKPRDVETVLREAPVGSRVMWSNVYLAQNPGGVGGTPNSFTNENTIKLGDDTYGAHGFFARQVFKRAELEAKLANVDKPSGMSTEQAIKTYIVIREIEYYTTIAEEPWERVAEDPDRTA
ncbi:eCIS core domain-containing protein [Ancylobacter oerskovii]|uniref:DUF4157 domain-containing protein n=1 Tax=Ancylobacter oerskovii TaxID=459519 RepID=A0ABW4Z0A5_9HYPH|nr:DUF4157 domain-containing protein [Ancylobacter oerskovii]MBS7542767.1 DUF4157 domain-containing protein [Ancylobacter oerskovii]